MTIFYQLQVVYSTVKVKLLPYFTTVAIILWKQWWDQGSRLFQ